MGCEFSSPKNCLTCGRKHYSPDEFCGKDCLEFYIKGRVCVKCETVVKFYQGCENCSGEEGYLSEEEKLRVTGKISCGWCGYITSNFYRVHENNVDGFVCYSDKCKRLWHKWKKNPRICVYCEYDNHSFGPICVSCKIKEGNRPPHRIPIDTRPKIKVKVDLRRR